MAMLYSFHENLELNDTESQFEAGAGSTHSPVERRTGLHLFEEKLRVPETGDLLPRPRLGLMLEKSSRHFGATLILGRAGTGKTSLAAEFARRYEKVAWYSIESSDNSWEVFSKYFAAAFKEPKLCRKETSGDETAGEIPPYVERLMGRLRKIDGNQSRLIVLDNAHYVFDSEWFTNFFTTLVYSLSDTTHFVLLSRCQPPLPLWRLRSKQVLGVIDEKMLAFNYEETDSFCERRGLSPEEIKTVYRKTFGRISKLKELTEDF